MDQVEIAVIGAGVVGLAMARELALRGHEVILIEAAAAFGTGISSRNSEVIHAGLYYPTGSLKARLCVRGKALLYDYCAARGIAHRRSGKLVVAPRDQDLPRLAAQPTGWTTCRCWIAAQRWRWSPRCRRPARCCRHPAASSTATA
jgi:L-2-hydroxyglutarate oxidase LhgO